jgi:diguanylate cyclase (GGDEF)-like protein
MDHHPAEEMTSVSLKTLLRRNVWAVLTSLLVLTGALGSLLAAGAVGHNAAVNSKKGLIASSHEVASTLQLAIEHEQDLVVSTDAFIASNPDITEAQFLHWMDTTSALKRYPELSGMSEIEVVPASQLSAFAAREISDPPGPLASDGTYQVTPPGTRPYYCLESVAQQRGPKAFLPAGFDYCDSSIASQLLKARDSGQSMYIPYKIGSTESLALGRATYANGTVPSTLAERRAQFVGLTGIVIIPRVLLSSALAGHPNTAVSFRYADGSSTATFKAGSAASNAQVVMDNLHNGWTVETHGFVQPGGIFTNADARATLLAGIALSLLLGALVLVLGTGRSRAREKLELRTAELQFLALHDPLTMLPNRALIIDRIEQMLARCRRTDLPCAVMFLDLDDFKDINDTLGHAVGDQVLTAVASRLTAALRDGDTVGRLGGDEFILLVEDTALSAGTEVVAERILEVLRPPFDISGHRLPIVVRASIGVAAGEQLTPDELLRHADVALYRAKAAGKGCISVFAPSMQTAVDDDRHLSTDLHHAVRAQEFFLLYQPTIDLRTGEFTGVEALIRWRRPERGIVGPDSFVPALERSGLIIPVGAWVLEEACRQGALWHAKGHHFTISVNVSAKQLEQDRIVDDVKVALLASGLDPNLLILELTETTLMNDVDQAIGRLRRLKRLGVRLAIDDFGTGYSSLSYLRKFPIDILKIDRSFVSGILDSVEAAALVHTLVELGKILKLETIAEGVEDDDQRRYLQREDVDTGQGFLFSRPLDAAAVDTFIENFRATSNDQVQEREGRFEHTQTL